MQPYEIVITIVGAIFGSTGFWSIVQRFLDSKSASRAMLLGLGRVKLMEQCNKYLDQGWVSIEDLADLEKYLYTPYKKLGGNGTGEMLYNKVNALPNKEVKDERHCTKNCEFT